MTNYKLRALRRLVATCKTKGLTVRRVDYSETSQVVTFITEGYGKLKVIAKGIKRPRSRLGGALDLLTDCELVFIEKPNTDLHLLTDCEVLEIFPALREHQGRAEAAFVVAELLDRFVQQGEQGRENYTLAVESLHAVASAGNRPALPLAAFIARLLRLHGLLPVAGHCVVCKRRFGGVSSVPFSGRRGGPLCKACAPLEPQVFKTARGALALLGALASPDRFQFNRLRVSPAGARALWALLVYYVSFVLGEMPATMSRFRM